MGVELAHGLVSLQADALAGAARFTAGAGRHGDFDRAHDGPPPDRASGERSRPPAAWTKGLAGLGLSPGDDFAVVDQSRALRWAGMTSPRSSLTSDSR